MSQFIGGIDPHQANFTVGIITPAGVEITHQAFPNSASNLDPTLQAFAAESAPARSYSTTKELKRSRSLCPRSARELSPAENSRS